MKKRLASAALGIVLSIALMSGLTAPVSAAFTITSARAPGYTIAYPLVPVNPPKTVCPPQTTNPPQTTDPSEPQTELSAFEKRVVELVNQERAKYGLKPLAVDAELTKIARLKSQDMHDKRYFDHNSPTYGSPFDMLYRFGIRYRAAGENIAMGYRTAELVMAGWMNSPGHRANILKESYTHIGVGFVSDGFYWTQLFISK